MNDDRRAPVQRETGRPAGSIDWEEHLLVWAAYNKRWPSQTAERIAERGGFGYGEACTLLGVTSLNTWTPNAPHRPNDHGARRGEALMSDPIASGPASEDYTPSDSWLRLMVGYAMTKAVDRVEPVEQARAQGYSWFDRWLAAHDDALLRERDEQIAAVGARLESAWRDGYFTGKRDYAASIVNGRPVRTPNPHGPTPQEGAPQ